MPFALLPIISGLWSNPLARTAILIAGAFLFGFWKGFAAVPRPDIPAIVRNAEAGRDAYWSRQLATQEEQARQAVDAAIEAGAHVAVAADADLVLLCARSPACRDRQ